MIIQGLLLMFVLQGSRRLALMVAIAALSFLLPLYNVEKLFKECQATSYMLNTTPQVCCGSKCTPCVYFHQT